MNYFSNLNTIEEQRKTAIGAVISEMKHRGLDPLTEEPAAALDVLDDLLRSEPNKIAAIWYEQATEYQFELFFKDWDIRQKKDIDRKKFLSEYYASTIFQSHNKGLKSC